jgi:alkylhydroperoxidase family enzyme
MPGAIAPLEHTQAGLGQAWSELGRAGGWFSGVIRVAIANAAREAVDCGFCHERKAALSPRAVQGEHSVTRSLGAAELPSALVDAIHRIATDPGRLSWSWHDELIAAGIAEEELVEATSIVGIVRIADSLSRALGQPIRKLPPSAPGEPKRRILSGTTRERGWVPMVAPEKAEGFVATMYEGLQESTGFVFNVARALTSVPEALRDFLGAFFPNYTVSGPVAKGGLNRTQVELLASTTSAWNDCFY